MWINYQAKETGQMRQLGKRRALLELVGHLQICIVQVAHLHLHCTRGPFTFTSYKWPIYIYICIVQVAHLQDRHSNCCHQLKLVFSLSTHPSDVRTKQPLIANAATPSSLSIHPFSILPGPKECNIKGGSNWYCTNNREFSNLQLSKAIVNFVNVHFALSQPNWWRGPNRLEYEYLWKT